MAGDDGDRRRQSRRARPPEELSVPRQVTMYLHEWQAVDRAAEEMGISRSEFLRRASERLVPGLFSDKKIKGD